MATLDGITNPPIDELLDKSGTKYSLVLYAAKRARQINAYYSQLGEGLLEYVGPLNKQNAYIYEFTDYNCTAAYHMDVPM